jgi:hypothetical protein
MIIRKWSPRYIKTLVRNCYNQQLSDIEPETLSQFMKLEPWAIDKIGELVESHPEHIEALRLLLIHDLETE